MENFNLLDYLIISHTVLAIAIGLFAKKIFGRSFFMWLLIAFLVPGISIILLIILGYEGIYCPHCNKKVRTNLEYCPHCGFHLKKFLEENAEREKIAKEKFKH